MNADERLALVPRLEVPTGVRLDMAVNAVRQRSSITDFRFDAIYPETLRPLSRRYWTPIEVARKASRMLVTDPTTSVLDVGSGAGKFCLVGALSTPGRFTGIEQRGYLVDVARSIARRYGVRRASYVHGDIREIDWGRFDAFYCFNPFAENLFEPEEQFDDLVELSETRRDIDLSFVAEALAKTRIGSRVVTYHGLGREMPPCFDCVDARLAGSDVLELWVKNRP